MTANLTGAQLALWVARAANLRIATHHRIDGVTIHSVLNETGRLAGYVGGEHTPRWVPHEDWAQGGPLIDRKRITVCDCGGRWAARVGEMWSSDFFPEEVGASIGPDALIAAMRALVYSVYGDMVPDEAQP